MCNFRDGFVCLLSPPKLWQEMSLNIYRLHSTVSGALQWLKLPVTLFFTITHFTLCFLFAQGHHNYLDLQANCSRDGSLNRLTTHAGVQPA